MAVRSSAEADEPLGQAQGRSVGDGLLELVATRVGHACGPDMKSLLVHAAPIGDLPETLDASAIVGAFVKNAMLAGVLLGPAALAGFDGVVALVLCLVDHLNIFRI